MNARDALSNLESVGGAEGLKQTYEVLRGKRHYIVGSLSRVKRHSGNFNIVSQEAVEGARESFAGQEGVTSKMVRQRLARRGISIETLEALNVLYVLVALGHARVDRRRSAHALFFNVSS
jgi:hypothetical protein